MARNGTPSCVRLEILWTATLVATLVGSVGGCAERHGASAPSSDASRGRGDAGAMPATDAGARDAGGRDAGPAAPTCDPSWSGFDVDPAWQRCEIDEDCRAVELGCDGCCNYTVIHPDFADCYHRGASESCEGYMGGVCDCIYFPTAAEIQCRAGRCRIAPPCPYVPPAVGTACAEAGQRCLYEGNVFRSCVDGEWTREAGPNPPRCEPTAPAPDAACARWGVFCVYGDCDEEITLAYCSRSGSWSVSHGSCAP